MKNKIKNYTLIKRVSLKDNINVKLEYIKLFSDMLFFDFYTKK